MADCVTERNVASHPQDIRRNNCRHPHQHHWWKTLGCSKTTYQLIPRRQLRAHKNFVNWFDTILRLYHRPSWISLFCRTWLPHVQAPNLILIPERYVYKSMPVSAMWFWLSLVGRNMPSIKKTCLIVLKHVSYSRYHYYLVLHPFLNR